MRRPTGDGQMAGVDDPPVLGASRSVEAMSSATLPIHRNGIISTLYTPSWTPDQPAAFLLHVTADRNAGSTRFCEREYERLKLAAVPLNIVIFEGTSGLSSSSQKVDGRGTFLS
jgi:hypothetical protein